MKRITYIHLLIALFLLGACSGQHKDEDIVDKGLTKTEIEAPVSISELKAQPSEYAARAKKQQHLLGSSSQQMQYERFASDRWYASEPLYRENYAHFENQPVIRTTEAPVSTFSIDVDTASFSNVRRMLTQGRLPLADAVRVEELINYFDYHYPYPDKGDAPFSVYTEIAPSPWNKNSHLLHIGIKADRPDKKELPAANLVFLVDVSGSMHSPDKLPLLKQSMKLLVKQMRAKDR
ncbi:MAG: von Willebrand factor type A domain-containing protein, partial [Gammaproteobacteria bacterium]|nr:von Willebrand factor type A domain-containing protein [Gammaproteobacteria bacterium]